MRPELYRDFNNAIALIQSKAELRGTHTRKPTLASVRAYAPWIISHFREFGYVLASIKIVQSHGSPRARESVKFL